MWRVYRVECDSVSLKYSLSYANWDGYFIWSRLFLFDFQSLGLEMKFWNSDIRKNFAIVKFQSGFFSKGIVKILEFVDLKKILSFKNFQYSKKNSWQFQSAKKKKKKKKKFWNFENCRYRGKSGKISRNINFRNLESQILKKSLWVSNRKFHKRNFRILKVTDIQEEVFERYRKLLILLSWNN